MRNKIAGLIMVVYSTFGTAQAPGSAAPPDLCREYAASGKYDRAIEECTKQIYGDVPVKYPEYSFNNRGAAFADKQQYDHAIADYNRAIELNPKYATAYYNRAVAHAKKRNLKKAVADFSKALELNPQYTAAREGRNQVMAELGRTGQLQPEIKAVEPAQPEPSGTRAVLSSSSAGTPEGHDSAQHEKHPARKGYTVQIGVFRVGRNAEALAARLRDKGYDAVIEEGSAGDGGVLHWVYVSAFENRQDAVKIATEIREKEQIEAIAVPR